MDWTELDWAGLMQLGACRWLDALKALTGLVRGFTILYYLRGVAYTAFLINMVGNIIHDILS